MTLGLRALLLIVAIILFVVAVFANDWPDWIAWGLAALAAALLVEEIGVQGIRLEGGGRRARGQ